MARVVFGQGVSDMVGKLGGSIFQHGASGAVIRNWSQPSNRRTASQTVSRAALQVVAAVWSGLSQSEKDAWNSFALATPIADKLNRSKFITGQNWFFRHARQLLGWGVPQSVWAPVRSAGFNAPEVQSYLDALGSAGLSISFYQTAALNRLVYRLAGLSLIGGATTIYPFAGTSTESCLFPLYRQGLPLTSCTGHNLTSGSYHEFGVQRGLHFDGVNKYVESLTWPTDTNQPYACVFQFTKPTPQAGAKYLFGNAEVGKYCCIDVNGTTNDYGVAAGGTGVLVYNTASIPSQAAIASYALNDLRFYFNQVQVATKADRVGQLLGSSKIYFGCGNIYGSPSLYSTLVAKLWVQFPATSPSLVTSVMEIINDAELDLR